VQLQKLGLLPEGMVMANAYPEVEAQFKVGSTTQTHTHTHTERDIRYSSHCTARATWVVALVCAKAHTPAIVSEVRKHSWLLLHQLTEGDVGVKVRRGARKKLGRSQEEGGPYQEGGNWSFIEAR
jgi:hypothetical protein